MDTNSIISGFNCLYVIDKLGVKKPLVSNNKITCYCKINGVIEEKKLYPRKISFSDGNYHNIDKVEYGDGITDKDVYFNKKDAEWFEEKTIVRNNGETITYGGDGKKFEFNGTQQELFNQLQTTLSKLRENGVRVFANSEDYQVYACNVNAEGFDVARVEDDLNRKIVEVDGSEDWKRVPKIAFKKVDMEFFGDYQYLVFNEKE